MTDPVPPTAPRLMDLARVLVVIRKRRGTIALFFSAVMTAAVIATILAPRVYRATTTVHLLPRAGREMNVEEVVDMDAVSFFEAQERARTQLKIIQSRTVRQEVVERYVAQGYDDLTLENGGPRALKDAMTVTPVEGTQLVEISVEHAQPEQAAVLANLTAEVYREVNLAARTDAARDSKDWLQGRTGEYRAEVEAANAQLIAFKAENDVVDIEEKIDGISARMTALHEARGEATTQRVLLETNLAEHERLLAAGEYAVLAGMFDDPTIEALAKEYADVVTRAAEIQARYGEQHPEHRWAVSHVQRVKGLLEEEVRRTVEAERSEVNTLRRQEARLESELDGVKAELLEKQKLKARYDEMKMEYERAVRFYEDLGARGTEVELQAGTRLNDVRIVDRALPPSEPYKPNVALNMAVALGVGLVGALGLAFLRERLDDTVASARDVEVYLQRPLLGVVPHLPAARAKNALYTHEKPRSHTAEVMRSVRGLLLSGAGRDRARRVLVTSAVEEEGKTSTAVGLAVAFAHLDHKVLLVDADLRAPRLHEVFQLPPEAGLVDAIAAEQSPLGLVARTQVAGLHVLVRGSAAEFPGELLASARVARVIEILSRSFDVLVFDSPPASVLADVLSMVDKVDAVLLVVREGRTGRSVALKTIDRIERMGGRLAGIVLSDALNEPGLPAGRYDDEPA